MKKLHTLTCAAVAGLLVSSSTGLAGTLTANSGSVSFNPSNVVTDNTIQVQQVDVDLLKLFGNATITQPATPVNVITLEFTGTFTSDTGDIFSAAYNFGITLNSANPVAFSLNGFVQVPPFQEFEIPGFDESGTIMQGTNNYSGTFASSPQPGVSGSFRAVLELNFSAPVAGDTLTLTIPNDSIDFQLAPTAIPEPSTYALLAAGLGALIVRSRRRKSE